jgi:hypothetical protein
MLTFGGLPTFLALPNLGARPRVFAGRVSNAGSSQIHEPNMPQMWTCEPPESEELAILPLCTVPLRSECGPCRKREHLSESDPNRYLPSNEGSDSSDWGTCQRARQAR